MYLHQGCNSFHLTKQLLQIVYFIVIAIVYPCEWELKLAHWNNLLCPPFCPSVLCFLLKNSSHFCCLWAFLIPHYYSLYHICVCSFLSNFIQHGIFKYIHSLSFLKINKIGIPKTVFHDHLECSCSVFCFLVFLMMFPTFGKLITYLDLVIFRFYVSTIDGPKVMMV